jgi:integrase
MRFHAPSGQAIFNYQGKRHYLGAWPNHPAKAPEEVQARYRNLVARICTGEDIDADQPEPNRANLTLAVLIDLWLGWAEKRYLHPKTKKNLFAQVRPLYTLFRDELASAIGPLKVQQAQRLMASQGRTRQGINDATGFIRQMFAWGVSQELIEPDQLARLKAMQPLRRGAIDAPEAPPREAVPLADVQATLPHLSPTVAAMVRLQLLTGMRPAEVCGLSMAEIDQSNPECWVYRPTHHKMAHLGRFRAVPLVREAIAILKPFAKENGKPVFSPADEVERWQKEKRANRKTKVQPSQLDRSRENPLRTPGDQYGTDTYRRAIHRACKEHDIPLWAPNRLRKLAAQSASDLFGLEAARALLGHSDSSITKRHYAQRDLEQARLAAQAIAPKLLD